MGTYLITGATGGIGRAIALRLSGLGHRLLLVGRASKRLSNLVHALPEGSRALAADLTQPELLEGALVPDLPDRLDGIVHSAGIVELGAVAETSTTTWQQALTVNLTSPAEITRLTLPALRANRGHVIFINSGAGQRANARWGAYAASKFGLRALADALRAEEHEHGIRVTSIYPGRTASEMQRKVHQQEGRPYDPERWIDPESVATAVLTALSLPRDAEVTDLTVRPGVSR
ncbi:SDR family oxidoreductase [Allostreptomyces psammosilenae]|uniref:NADP-dependent 3-hydroxy acid dehydrogenase YdfG n=1 Tax=Allostreptomyces psammosilenae TaxID=1892865 RepID=A0A852ZWZ7_9ACTN|nr:SDR family oxidoreductase [Allostreptomyces psammosilenae]NYI03171.1 NADP-dependent 3-hydroxy acid dehydrogenase YdfG [Allostreptomyces psammosilenae]